MGEVGNMCCVLPRRQEVVCRQLLHQCWRGCSQIRSAKFGHCWVDRTKTYSQIVRWLRVICDEDGPLVSIIDALNMDKCSLRISKITLGCVYYGKLLQVGRIVFESIQCAVFCLSYL